MKSSNSSSGPRRKSAAMERYRHYRPQKTAAERIGRIFVPDQAEAMSEAARLTGDD